MAADQHEALIRAYIDEVFNGHHVDALDKYWDDDLTSHWLGMETIHGLPGKRVAMEGFFAALSGRRLHLGRGTCSSPATERCSAWPLAGDPAGRLARDRRVRPQRDVDRHHHRPLRRRQADRGLGRAGPARPLPAARVHSNQVVGAWRNLVAFNTHCRMRAAFAPPNRRWRPPSIKLERFPALFSGKPQGPYFSLWLQENQMIIPVYERSSCLYCLLPLTGLCRSSDGRAARSSCSYPEQLHPRMKRGG